jgi:acetoin utilization deacetylase AcuC-like enzyme
MGQLQTKDPSGTGLVLSNELCAHKAQGLPERPERIQAVRAGLQQANLLDQLVLVDPPHSSNLGEREMVLNAIKANHNPEYVDYFASAYELQTGEFPRAVPDMGTGDTPLSAATFDVTWRATGSVLRCIDRVATGELRNAFCAIRPPGHHAEPDHATGFCYVNHVAVAARHLLLNKEGFLQPDGSRVRINRVMIVDPDLHHGNGAQKSFWASDEVFFCSLHGDPRTLRYPGTGSADQRGKHGNILNIPLPRETGSLDYRTAFEEQFLPAADRFRPDFILISMGFDTHRADPFDYMRLVEDDYAWITAMLVDQAERHCSGRLVSMMEGGYNLSVLGRSAAAHVGELVKGSGKKD